MKIVEISLDRYARLLPETHSAYDSARFIALNSAKVPRVRVMALTDDSGEIVVAQAFGEKSHGWHAPFSAPFSVPYVAGEGAEIDFYRQLPGALGAPVHLTLPAQCYHAGIDTSAGEAVLDYNYHYPLERVAAYESYLSRSGRYSHHRAMKHDFKFERTDDIARAYDVIRINREALGYPLAMSLEQVVATSPITRGLYFVLSLDGRDVASAVVFHPMPGIAQLIYWGDVPEARQFRAMNSLPWHLFSWYAEHRPDIGLIDIGPSSTNGVINRGLADYKLSIGCIETMKPSIVLT